MPATTRVVSHVNKALRESPIAALRRLHLEETDDEVVISGFVSSYYLKQMAQETVLPLLGQRELLNQVMVIRAGN